MVVTPEALRPSADASDVTPEAAWAIVELLGHRQVAGQATARRAAAGLRHTPVSPYALSAAPPGAWDAGYGDEDDLDDEEDTDP